MARWAVVRTCADMDSLSPRAALQIVTSSSRSPGVSRLVVNSRRRVSRCHAGRSPDHFRISTRRDSAILVAPLRSDAQVFPRLGINLCGVCSSKRGLSVSWREFFYLAQLPPDGARSDSSLIDGCGSFRELLLHRREDVAEFPELRLHCAEDG